MFFLKTSVVTENENEKQNIFVQTSNQTRYNQKPENQTVEIYTGSKPCRL